MIPKEILKQVRKIEIRSGKLVNEIFAGQYSSVFKGRGMEFDEVREYMPGDDIRSIDWNVTARYGRPFIKKFVEERELTVILLVDVSGSQQFGTGSKFKSELAAEIASVLAFSAIRNNDRVGMIMFSDKIEKVIRPKKGRNHILRLIREMVYFKPTATGTNISLALENLNELWRRKAVVFLISDFQDQATRQSEARCTVPNRNCSGLWNFEKASKVTAKRHDLISIQIADPFETNVPALGLLNIEDPETGRRFVVDTSDRDFEGTFASTRNGEFEHLKNFFKRAGIDHILIQTDRPYIKPLINFFRQREKRLSY
jgi:uncharacterized protein (DUF58 family)